MLQKIDWPELKKKVYPILIVGGGLFFAYLVYRVGTDFFKSDLRNSWKPQYFFFAIPPIIIIHFLQILNYFYVIREGHRDIDFQESLIAYASTFIPKYIPGAIWGYLARDRLLSVDYFVPSRWVWETSIYEVLYVICSGLFVAAYWYFSSSFRVILTVFGIAILFFVWKAIVYLSNKFGNYSKAPLRFRTWLMVNVVTSLQWALYGLSLHYLCRAININDTPLLALSSTYAFAWILGFLVVIVPFGLGIREMTLSTILNKVVGIPNGAATFVAVVSRITVIISELTWFLLAITLRALQKRSN